MNKYSDLMKTLKRVKNEENTQDVLFAQSFLKEFNTTLIEMEKEREQEVPTGYYRPSSIAGCKRMLYAMRTGVPKEEDYDPILIGICEAGTDRHERIQKVVMKMPNVTWLDPEKEVEKARLMGINTKIVEKRGNEVRCVNDDLFLYFQCDGIIRYGDKKVLLELKTESSMKWGKRVEPEEEHREQATCYGMGFGIDYVLYIYEDRNFTDKKPYLFHITQDYKDRVFNKILTVNDAVEKGVILPKEDDKCTYCRYKKWCAELY